MLSPRPSPANTVWKSLATILPTTSRQKQWLLLRTSLEGAWERKILYPSGGGDAMKPEDLLTPSVVAFACSVGLVRSDLNLPLAALDHSVGYVAGADPLFREGLPHGLTAGRDSDPGIYVGQVTLYGCF